MSSSCTRLYLGGLPHFVGVEEVSKHLAGFGKLVEVKIHRGYGFVAFDKEKDASDVFKVFSRHPFMGTNITVEYARPPHRAKVEGDRLTSSKDRYGSIHAKLRYLVTVINIPRGACWQELKDFGRQAGGFVAFCNIDRYGTGFIEYTSRDDAHRAVSRLSGTKLHGSVVTLSTRENDENRKPTTDLRARSRSPPHDRLYTPYSTSSSSTFLAETSLGKIDSHNDGHGTRSRSVYQHRGRTSTDTSSAEASFDQIDLHMYGFTSRDVLAPFPPSNGGDYDYYDSFLLGKYEEGKHRPGISYYTDPKWAYM